MQVKLMFLAFVCCVIIFAPTSNGYIIIDPITGREVVVSEEQLASEQDTNEEYLSQNIPISPGDFVRGRTSTIQLKYPQVYRNNRTPTDETDISQSLNNQAVSQGGNVERQNQQDVEDRPESEYLLPNGTPIYKFFKRNPYGG